MASVLRPFQRFRAGFRWSWRASVFLLVVFSGVAGMRAGVELSERPGLPTEEVPAQLYYTLGLFVFGGLDLGVPRGGPQWAHYLLWAVFFAAPAITTSALIEGLLLLLQPYAWRLRRLRDHIVIGGCGRLTLLYIDRLRQKNRKQQILVVESRLDHPLLETVSEMARTQVVFGNIASEAVLRAARLDHARRVVLLTGDDYANLDAASRISKIRPELASQTLVHVSDIRLLRVIEQQEILNDVAKFNSYRTAASYLVNETLVPHFRTTERLDTVVLAGFGRFGQTVLHELQEHAAGLFETVVIVDLKAELRTLVFAEQIGFADGYRREVLDGDLRHPGLWQSVRQRMGKLATRPVYILGSGDDGVNIRIALWLSSKKSEARIVARCFDQSSFTEEISGKCGFEVVSTADLLLASMRPEWQLPEEI